MRHLALEEEGPDDETIVDFTPLIEPLFPAVVNVQDRVVSVTLQEPRRESPAGHCACEACRAANLPDLGIQFR